MKKRTLFLGFLLMLALSTAALAADYTDVPADSWARESIDKAAEYGLMNGVGEGRFGLGETISREQFVTILVRMFGWESVSGEDAAVDIADSWAREFVNTAAANGVIDAGGKFRPRDAITRRDSFATALSASSIVAPLSCTVHSYLSASIIWAPPTTAFP